MFPKRGARTVSEGAGTAWAQIFQSLQRDPNDVPAWEALRLHVRLWAQADLWGRGEAAVEEAVADTCARVGVALRTARGAATFGGFVKAQYLAARREVLKFLGQPLRVLGGDLLPDPPDEGATVEELVVEGPYRRQALQRCLRRLPERERTAIELLYFRESGVAGVAAALGVTRLNARQILWQARTRLRDCLQHLWQTA